MKNASEIKGKVAARALWAALRPAVPAVIGAGALTFLFGALMPMDWVGGIGWNLYLDRLSDLFAPPVGNGARLVLALGMAAVAALIAGVAALLIARPQDIGLARRKPARARDKAADKAEAAPPRRRADRHPDDPPRPPIRAGRDLPAEGLFPTAPAPVAEPAPVDAADERVDELMLADLAPDENITAGEEPWLQAAAADAGPLAPDPADNSLGAMVARLEAGLARRGRSPAAQPAEESDFALQAALGTLQRMNRRATG